MIACDRRNKKTKNKSTKDNIASFKRKNDLKEVLQIDQKF